MTLFFFFFFEWADPNYGECVSCLVGDPAHRSDRTKALDSPGDYLRFINCRYLAVSEATIPIYVQRAEPIHRQGQQMIKLDMRGTVAEEHNGERVGKFEGASIW